MLRHSWVVTIHSLPCFAKHIPRSITDTPELTYSYVAKSKQNLKTYGQIMQDRHVEYIILIFLNSRRYTIHNIFL
jgi:hypothetical protein